MSPDPLPSDDAPPTDRTLLHGLWEGEPAAADLFYERYAERVRRVARAKLSRGLARRMDVDDIVQSVFRRFSQAARQGRYDLPSGEELWDLLLVITLNRLRSAEQFHRAGKRDLRLTVGLESADSDDAHADAFESFLAVVVDEALARLPDHYREVVQLRMHGYEVGEIAAAVGRSKRTVERTLQEARGRLKILLAVEP